MKKTRREFLAWMGAGGALLTIMATGLGWLRQRPLEGRVRFEDWRALPGMRLRLWLELESAETTWVDIYREEAGQRYWIERLRGARELSYQAPWLPTRSESFALVAVVSDRWGRRCESEPLEVLTRNYCFGS